jgi:CO/xanthine dehydrogenase Mo-binding subunit
VTYVTGNAMLKAARTLKKTLEPLAEEILGEKDLVFLNEEISSIAHPEKRMAFSKLAKEAHLAGLQIVVTAWQDITTADVNPETGQGDAYATYSYASQIAEVEVDTETGKVEVLRVVAAHDVGKAINPCNVEGQIEGGVVQGLGFAVMEKVVQEGGVLKTKSLGEYTIPTSMDVPRIDSHIVEVPVSSGPYGAKGVGEPALIPTAPAILNAIYNAVGVRVTETPATMETIRRLIQESKE